jgi:hypothetical protein
MARLLVDQGKEAAFHFSDSPNFVVIDGSETAPLVKNEKLHAVLIHRTGPIALPAIVVDRAGRMKASSFFLDANR